MLFLAGFSQVEWAPVGAEWYYTNPNYVHSPPSNPNLQCVYYKSLKDTLIDQKSCRKIEVSYCRDGHKIGFLLLHQNNDSIFYYNDSDFFLLYNFSAKPGDTIVVHSKKFKVIPAFLANEDSIDYFKYKILKLDSLKINGSWYRRQQVAYIKGGDWGFMRTPSYIIEKIGSNNYFLGRSVNIFPEMEIGMLRCYDDSQINYKDNDWHLECNFTTYSNIIENPTSWYFAHTQLEDQFIDTIFTGEQHENWTDLWYHGVFMNNEKTYMGKVKCSLNNDSVWYLAPDATEAQLVFNLNLGKGDMFDFGKGGGGQFYVDSVYYKNSRKYVEFNGDNYWGDKMQFIEGVGPNLSFIYAWNVGILQPYVVCQFKWRQKFYSTDNDSFQNCDFLINSIDQTEHGDIQIFPNPFTNELKIEFKDHRQGFVCVLDLFGKIIYQQDFQGNVIAINTTNFVCGMYLLKIFTNNYHVTYKILKQ